MSISLGLSIASGELGNINSQFALIGQNIANANTRDYAVETIDQQSVTAGGVGIGTRDGVVQREIDTQVQGELFAQNGTAASFNAQAAGLQQIDAAQGTPGSGTDLASRLGAVQNAFAALLNDPSNAAQQSAVVQAAQQFSGQVNAVSNAIGTARQAAQDGIAGDVQAANTALGQIGTLSNQIIAARNAGQSTADLENQRDAAMDTLSGLIGVTYHAQTNGDVLVVANGGLVLPTHGNGPAL